MLTTASTVWTALKPADRPSSPQMFQMRVPQIHAVHRQNARTRLAWPRLMRGRLEVAAAGGGVSIIGTTVPADVPGRQAPGYIDPQVKSVSQGVDPCPMSASR